MNASFGATDDSKSNEGKFGNDDDYKMLVESVVLVTKRKKNRYLPFVFMIRKKRTHCLCHVT